MNIDIVHLTLISINVLLIGMVVVYIINTTHLKKMIQDYMITIQDSLNSIVNTSNAMVISSRPSKPDITYNDAIEVFNSIINIVIAKTKDELVLNDHRINDRQLTELHANIMDKVMESSGHYLINQLSFYLDRKMIIEYIYYKASTEIDSWVFRYNTSDHS